MSMSRRESRVSHTEGVTLLAHASPVPSRPIKYPIHVPTSLVRASAVMDGRYAEQIGGRP